MKIYFTLDGGYLNGVSSTSMRLENEYSLEVEKDHEVLRIPDIFKYKNGKLIKDEERQKKLIAESEKTKNKPTDEEMNAVALMELTEFMMGGE